jgi:hypothetical protein
VIRAILSTLGLGLVLSGCAAAYAPKPVTDEHAPHVDRREVADHHRALRQAEEELGASLQAATTPDCDRACELGATVCKLSARICAIADRHPSDADLAGRCRDGRERCDRARRKVTDRCGCPGQFPPDDRQSSSNP